MTQVQEEKPDEPTPKVISINWRLYLIIIGVMIVIFNIVAALVVKFYIFT